MELIFPLGPSPARAVGRGSRASVQVAHTGEGTATLGACHVAAARIRVLAPGARNRLADDRDPR